MPEHVSQSEAQRLIYMDHAATTALDPRVLESMMPHLTEQYGNASSIYALAETRNRG